MILGSRDTIGSYDPDRPHRLTGPLGPNPILFAIGLITIAGIALYYLFFK